MTHPTEDPDTIPATLREAAQLHGDAAALVDGDLRLSFSDLDIAVDRIAAGFVATGLEVGDRVALWAPNRAEWILACLGAQSAGGICVPLNTRLKGGEAAFILNRSRARLLVMAGQFLNNDYVAELSTQTLLHLAHRIVLDSPDWEALQGADTAQLDEARRRRAALRGNDPADIVFTSGTTGKPKGVVCGHGQSVRVFKAWADTVGLRAGDRYLVVNPFFHTFGYKAGWLACLLSGATIYPQLQLDVPQMIDRIAAHRISVLAGPPTVFQSLLERPAPQTSDLSSLRVAVTGASTVAPSLIERMRGELGIGTVLTGYGLTESCGVVTLSAPEDSPETVVTTCGKAIDGVELRCVDAQMFDVPQGENGEVVVRGFNVMQGYFEDDAATAAAIDAQGWLHTGDIGRLDIRGYLQITGRMKDMYISGGFNCYPAEIERIIAGHKAVAQVAVIGVEDVRLGEVGKAFVVLRPGAHATEAELLTWCRGSMANYKAPRHIELRDTLPQNASGKVQKSQLEAEKAGSVTVSSA